jgi:hypothetical protein
MSKQTAVEWLVKELNQKIDFIPMDKWDMIRDIVQQAKEMEKWGWIPSDEEIENWSSYDSQSELERIGMVRGAKWMKKKILKNK